MDKTMPSKVKDLTNNIYGRLTVIRFDKISANGHSYWWCKCKCGNEVSVLGLNLKNGKIKACGCMRKEVSQKKRNYLEQQKK